MTLNQGVQVALQPDPPDIWWVDEVMLEQRLGGHGPWTASAVKLFPTAPGFHVSILAEYVRRKGRWIVEDKPRIILIGDLFGPGRTAHAICPNSAADAVAIAVAMAEAASTLAEIEAMEVGEPISLHQPRG
ncbi:hypothetical protein BN12_220019 [Nostocoides japonicum T1-X7]|uniref:Uncharacterized protein n=1 Tax=Nostocoides japonicum T1-X7 TaxID=1194083 RepID=A0A077LVN4_9MICO|nr:hypothetical protein [Tetrasphaera japonica]CCH77741.1 hypothetical protein BN12_220019 [Tetrasphaera japonica T1-X7]